MRCLTACRSCRLFDLPEVQQGFVHECSPHEKEAPLLLEGITCACCSRRIADPFQMDNRCMQLLLNKMIKNNELFYSRAARRAAGGQVSEVSAWKYCTC